MARHDYVRLKFSLCACLTLSPDLSRAETISASVGMEQTNAVSSSYATAQKSSLQLDATYLRTYTGRWSFFAQYQMNTSGTMAGGIGGFTYDSADIIQRGGGLSFDGNNEITRLPLYFFRFSAGAGYFKYVDILLSNDPNRGTRNQVPIQADMVGLKLAGSVARVMDTDWGLHLGTSYLVASANNFGVSSTSFLFGAFYFAN
jgi:hypothetical protein